MTDSPQVIGEARCYVELLKLLEIARKRLDVPYSVLDNVSGLPDGYSQKVLQRAPQKHMGPLSLGLMLKAEGVKIVLMWDEPQLAKNAKRSDWRRSRPQGGWKFRGTNDGQRTMGAANKRAYPHVGSSEWGSMMRQRAMVLLTPAARQRAARKAGRASGRARLRRKLMDAAAQASASNNHKSR